MRRRSLRAFCAIWLTPSALRSWRRSRPVGSKRWRSRYSWRSVCRGRSWRWARRASVSAAASSRSVSVRSAGDRGSSSWLESWGSTVLAVARSKRASVASSRWLPASFSTGSLASTLISTLALNPASKMLGRLIRIDVYAASASTWPLNLRSGSFAPEATRSRQLAARSRAIMLSGSAAQASM